jgi:hypothetical protein
MPASGRHRKYLRKFEIRIKASFFYFSLDCDSRLLVRIGSSMLIE